MREGSRAIRDPSAIPSNIWWKRMTMKRVMKLEEPATTRVIPITVVFPLLAGDWEERVGCFEGG